MPVFIGLFLLIVFAGWIFGHLTWLGALGLVGVGFVVLIVWCIAVLKN